MSGQEHIAPVLRAMVHQAQAEDVSFPQAMIFHGPRGTGKTSVARILSKALNCANPQAGEPCDECVSCTAIRDGRSSGVNEMDMASHGSVNDIRELKRTSVFALVEEWHVHLMDEVHSASREAFDALLKLLEEPPPKNLFLLLTTEPDQIPETIQSRCMPYEFRRIGLDHIEARLRLIAHLHGVDDKIDPEVYRLLAVNARGGMRDAVMKLEQVARAGDRVTIQTVKDTFGVSDLPQRLLDAALKGDLQRGLRDLRQAIDSASPPIPILEGMLDGLSALLAASTGLPPDSAAIVEPEWVTLHAPTPAAHIISAMTRLWDARGRMTTGGSAPAALAVAYGMVVRELAPSIFAQAAPAAPRSAAPISPVSQASPPHANGTQAARTLSPEALAAVLSSESLEDALRRLESS